MAATIKIQPYGSPCGELLLGVFGDRLCLCDWMGEGRHEAIRKRLQKALCAEFEVVSCELLVRAANSLDAYFAGKHPSFDLPLLFVGTDFQRSVWNELLRIPYGATISYSELSRRLDHPKAVRAVAAANGANPISIFVPCHRVIGSNHTLTGYGGGLTAKRWLLELESKSTDHIYPLF